MRRALRAWHAIGEPYALATVAAVRGSAPREVGAALAVDSAGGAVGSVSSGCVDAEVYERCRKVLRTGEVVRRTFEPDPDDPFAPAMTCGGTVDVVIRRIDPPTDSTVRRRTGPAALPRRSRPGRGHPEEAALSIGAETVAPARGGSGLPLRDTAGAIHHSDTPRRAEVPWS
jgi:xanthine dehydrogenase accessory factor